MIVNNCVETRICFVNRNFAVLHDFKLCPSFLIKNPSGKFLNRTGLRVYLNKYPNSKLSPPQTVQPVSLTNLSLIRLEPKCLIFIRHHAAYRHQLRSSHRQTTNNIFTEIILIRLTVL